jgi:hypothetical protein
MPVIQERDIRRERFAPTEELPFDPRSKEDPEATRGGWRVERVEDGWLVGFDSGEWGGGVWWFDKPGKQSVRLTDDRVVTFARLGDRNVVIHESLSKGEVVALDRGDAGWQATKLTHLHGRPLRVLQESADTLLIRMYYGLVRVHESGRLTRLVGETLPMTWARSMALSPGGVVYVGMLHLVERFRPSGDGYFVDWLVRADCPYLKYGRHPNFSCHCVHTPPSRR